MKRPRTHLRHGRIDFGIGMAEGSAYIAWNPSMRGLRGPSYPEGDWVYMSQYPYKVWAVIHWCPVSCQEQLEVSVSCSFYVTCAVCLFIYTLWTVTMCCYQLWDIPLDLSQPITGSLASQYWTSSVIGGGPIYSVKMLRSTALRQQILFLLSWMYGLQQSLVFKINFSWKSQEKNYRVFDLVDVGQKRRF